MTVTIGCPISNRIHLVNKYLDAIYRLEYPKRKIKLYFLINNSNDGTEQELKDFRRKYKDEYIDISIERYKMPSKQDRRIKKTRNEMYSRLAELRNYVLSKIDTDYFFSVDSDIILSSNILTELLKADKDIIAAVINNDQISRPYEKYPKIRTNILMNTESGIKHWLDFPLNEIVEVDYTGAVYLMTKNVAETIRYEYSEYGEDIPFCDNAKKNGFKIYCHTGLWQTHVMCEYQNYCIENKCQNPCIELSGKIRVYGYRYIDNVVYPILARCGKLISGSKLLLENLEILNQSEEKE